MNQRWYPSLGAGKGHLSLTFFVHIVIGTPQAPPWTLNALLSTLTPASPSFLGSPVLLVDHQELQPHPFLVKPCFLGLAGDGSLQGCVQPGLVRSLK